jgi:hypothetical protein
MERVPFLPDLRYDVGRIQGRMQSTGSYRHLRTDQGHRAKIRVNASEQLGVLRPRWNTQMLPKVLVAAVDVDEHGCSLATNEQS